MALDPQAKALIDQMTAAGQPPIHTMTPEAARQMYEMTSPMLDAQGVEVAGQEDRKIPGPSGEIPIRIYSPLEANGGPLPLMVFFHGGGFVVGSINTHNVTCKLLANACGCKLISVDYRMAPGSKFPIPVLDCWAATQWAAENAAELGADASRLAVAGDSAGGNLAAVMTQIARQEGGPSIAYQMLIYPVTDTGNDTESRNEFATGYFLEKAGMDWFHDQYTSSETDWADFRCSPLKAEDFSGLPPAHVVTAGFDPLRDEGIAYADKLKAAGVPTTHINYEGMIHGFFNMTGVIDEARRAISTAGEEFKRVLGGVPA